jgi:predicted secreted Zn-dependent protease
MNTPEFTVTRINDILIVRGDRIVFGYDMSHNCYQEWSKIGTLSEKVTNQLVVSYFEGRRFRSPEVATVFKPTDVIVNNYAGVNVDCVVGPEGEVHVNITRKDKRSLDKEVAKILSNPNSAVSRALVDHTSAERRRQ